MTTKLFKTKYLSFVTILSKLTKIFKHFCLCLTHPTIWIIQFRFQTRYIGVLSKSKLSQIFVMSCLKSILTYDLDRIVYITHYPKYFNNQNFRALPAPKILAPAEGLLASLTKMFASLTSISLSISTQHHCLQHKMFAPP